MRRIACLAVVWTMAFCVSATDMLFETEKFTLTINDRAQATSLKLKENGEELLNAREGIALFSTTQKRPFNNEIKLAWPNKQTTYQANRARLVDGCLHIGFNIAPYEAIVRVTSAAGYLKFTLESFDCDHHKAYGALCLDTPPVDSFRLVQLPVKNRKNLGDWLNVMWDDRGAAAVVAVSPYEIIDHEKRFGFELLTADLRRGMRLRGGSAALIVGAGREDFLDSMDAFEEAENLPRGVQSRKNPLMKASIYWSSSVRPKHIDEHIALAQKAGLRMMLFYFTSFARPAGKGGGYATIGDYDWPVEYPNGEKDVRAMLAKVKAAGITPGLHALQTYIGFNSRYVTPVADPRLNLKRLFTLAQPLPATTNDCELFVTANPADAPLYNKTRVLKFGGELLTYEGYTTVPPYKFTGVKRGHVNTTPQAHVRGEIGGVLDVSEYGGGSCYIDQTTDLQDEIAEKLARIYNQGIEFCYFDGSEGVNEPCGVNVSLSQYRVVRKFKKMPIFTEGAAKSHFGWHLQAGANAFDYFPPEIFKAMLIEHPMREAAEMQKNFTRLDFGWWRLYLPGEMVRLNENPATPKIASIGTQPDMWEFGTSRAAAWDCPATIQFYPSQFKKHPRADDLAEVMRRWEDVRFNGFLTPERKEALKSTTQEHHLYINEYGEYELHEIEMLPTPESGVALRGFVFEREGKRVVVYWNAREKSGLVTINLGPQGERITLPLDKIRYHVTALDREVIKKSFKEAW